MIETPLFIACIMFSASMTILAFYFAEFLRFVKRSKREEYVQNLNRTVEKIFEYKQTDMSNVVIDITDYQEIRPNIEHISDAYLEELANNSLIYMDDVKMWIKVNKR
jgi:hypothetical protein